MKIVIAPDSFKESMTAIEAAEAIERGWRRVFPNDTFSLVPMADGGEGTVQSMVDATGGHFVEREVQDPLGKPVLAKYGILGDGKTAVIEMAEASGLGLVPKAERNPLITTTYGTGQLILDALQADVTKILIGIGGSATNDGGAGMLQALGGRLLDQSGAELPFGGAALADLSTIDLSDLDPRVKNLEIIAACDVDNPLTGPLGASAIFGPQKGADEGMVQELDRALSHFAEVIRKDLGVDVETTPGAGAAGGLGAGLMAFLQAKLMKGVDIVIEHTDLKAKMRGAELVITGEGGIDAQTRFGKTPYGVAKTAKALGIPVIAIAGHVKEDSRKLYEHGFQALFSIVQGACSLEDALRDGAKNLEATTENIARLYAVAKSNSL